MWQASISFPPTPMLWKYNLQFSGMLDAPNSLVEARRLLIEKMKADPAAFISKLEAAEPSCQGFVDLAKRVCGI